MRLRRFLSVFAAVAAGLALSACDPAQTGELGPASASPVQSEAVQPAAQWTESPSVRPTEDPVPVPTETIPAQTPAVEETVAAATPTPVPSALEGDVTGLTVLDLTGDGTDDILIFDPARIGPSGTLLVSLNGVDYETTIPADGTAYEASLCSLWTDSPSRQLIVVREFDDKHDLYLFSFDNEGMHAADFTYVIPRELSETYEEQQVQGVPSLLYSGIDPIVIMGDGSFAVLGYGSGFRRYEADQDLHITETGALPLGLLSGVTAAPVAG